MKIHIIRLFAKLYFLKIYSYLQILLTKSTRNRNYISSFITVEQTRPYLTIEAHIMNSSFVYTVTVEPLSERYHHTLRMFI